MKQRQTELDMLRVAALLGVVALHVAAGPWRSVPIGSIQWILITLQRVSWPVPVFVMISGRFFLDPAKPVDGKTLFGKYILRIVTAFLFWGIVYQGYYWLSSGASFMAQWKSFVVGIFTGAYHMWYLWMLLGLYALTPVLRKIGEDQKLTGYFLAISIAVLTAENVIRYLPMVGDMVSQILDKMHPHFVMGYTVYYLLGIFLHRQAMAKWQEVLLYIAGAVSFFGVFAAQSLYAAQTGSAFALPGGDFSPAVILQAAAVYCFFTKRLAAVNWSGKARKVLALTTKWGFGAYLVHVLVLELGMNGWIGRMLIEWPLVAIPGVTLVVAGVSYGCAAVLQRIPGIGKYIA